MVRVAFGGVCPTMILKDAARLPRRQEAEDKHPLQPAVQLIKRWRDLAFGGSVLAPISIILTTLAADRYRGESSVSASIMTILDGISQAVVEAEAVGRRLVACNPYNADEDLSERWDDNQKAYDAFKAGIEDFRHAWSRVIEANGNVNKILEELFGEPVKAAVLSRARLLQEARQKNQLGVGASGLIATLPSSIPVKPNTFYGEN